MIVLAIHLGLVGEPSIFKPASLLAFGIQTASLIQTIKGVTHWAIGERKMKFNSIKYIWKGIGWLLRRIPNVNNVVI